MKKFLMAMILFALLAGSMSLITSADHSKARKALAAYKAQLRAQSEKLTFEEAGYPFPLETNARVLSPGMGGTRLGAGVMQND